MKKTVACLLCVVLLLGALPFAAADRDLSLEESLATDLKVLGLFQGVSDTDFDLARAPSRTEALIMLIRVLGRESEALDGDWTHPFTDVADWADEYIGFAYENSLTNGISATEFGSGSADAAMYLTFVLRALGYSDANGGDFTWNNPFPLATSAGILPEATDTLNFWRADVVLISYAALDAKLKGSEKKLSQKLIEAEVFTGEQLQSNFSMEKFMQVKTALSSEAIYARCSPAVFYLEVFDADGTALGQGSGFFIASDGTAVTNYHVVVGAHSAKITTADTETVYDVEGIYDFSELDDWAIIKVNGSGFPYLQRGAASTIVGGAAVYAIGSPLGLKNTITQGIISNPSRLDAGTTYIQTSTPISPGSSGGALINQYGEVIGIISAFFTGGQNLNLALPLSYLSTASRKSVVTLAQTEASRDSFRSLAAFVAHRGERDTENNSYYIQEDSFVEGTYRITYYPEKNQVVFSSTVSLGEEDDRWKHLKADDPIEVSLTMNGIADTYPCSVIYPTLNARVQGNLNAKPFSITSTLKELRYEGQVQHTSECMHVATLAISDLLISIDIMLYYNDIPLAIEDFGFDSLNDSIYS